MCDAQIGEFTFDISKGKIKKQAATRTLKIEFKVQTFFPFFANYH